MESEYYLETIFQEQTQIGRTNVEMKHLFESVDQNFGYDFLKDIT